MSRFLLTFMYANALFERPWYAQLGYDYRRTRSRSSYEILRCRPSRGRRCLGACRPMLRRSRPWGGSTSCAGGGRTETTAMTWHCIGGPPTSRSPVASPGRAASTPTCLKSRASMTGTWTPSASQRRTCAPGSPRSWRRRGSNRWTTFANASPRCTCQRCRRWIPTASA